MPDIILLNKPYDVLSQFTDKQSRATLADYVDIPDFYPAGRLDRDSEGLLLLCNNGELAHKLTHPKFKQPKTYWVQVEGDVNDSAYALLRRGVELNDGLTAPAKVQQIDAPTLWPRTNPVRFRKNRPTHWLSITITEGRNRQVRRMTAAVGLPTLRLVRAQIGPWQLADLNPGEFRIETVHLAVSDKPAIKESTYKKRRPPSYRRRQTK